VASEAEVATYWYHPRHPVSETPLSENYYTPVDTTYTAIIGGEDIRGERMALSEKLVPFRGTQLQKRFKKHVAILRIEIECQYGLLRELNRREILSEKQLAYINTANQMSYEQNDRLLQTMIQQNDETIRNFMSALRATHQSHLVRYIEYDDYVEVPGGDRPLRNDEQETIRNRYSFLVEHITLQFGFLEKMCSVYGCISNDHLSAIEQESDKYNKNRKLLAILKRRSFDQFLLFYKCLSETNQLDVVHALRMSKTMTSVDVYIDVSDSKQRAEIQRIIGDQFRRMVVMSQRNIAFDAILVKIDAKLAVLVHIPRFRFYFVFESERAMRHQFDSGELKKDVELLFKYLLMDAQFPFHPVRVKFISLNDYCSSLDSAHQDVSISNTKMTGLPNDLIEQVLVKSFLVKYVKFCRTTLQPRSSIIKSLSSVCASWRAIATQGQLFRRRTFSGRLAGLTIIRDKQVSRFSTKLDTCALTLLNERIYVCNRSDIIQVYDAQTFVKLDDLVIRIKGS